MHIISEQPAGQTVDDEQHAEKHDNNRQHRRIVELPHDDALNGDPRDESKRERDQECRPVRHAGLDQRQRDIGGEHRLFALREIDVMGRLKDHHQREADAGIDAAIGEAGQKLVQEGFHRLNTPDTRGARRRRCAPAPPDR